MWRLLGFVRFCLVVNLACGVHALTSPGVLNAQTGSITGTIRDGSGTVVKYALVTATSLSTAATKGFIGRVPSALNGTFTFRGLPAGSYFLCAQVPVMTYGPNDDHFVDSCIW